MVPFPARLSIGTDKRKPETTDVTKDDFEAWKSPACCCAGKGNPCRKTNGSGRTSVQEEEAEEEA